MKRTRGGRLAACLVAAVAINAGAALAFFTGSAGSQTATASVATLSPPGSAAAGASAANVTVSWTAATIGTAAAATSYTVERYSGTGTDIGPASCGTVPSSSGTPNAFGSFSCSDAPGTGAFEYKITAHYNSSWSSTSAFTNVTNVTATTVAAPGTAATGAAIAPASIGASLAGASTSPAAGGTISFTVFGPQATAPTSCASGGTPVGTATVSGNGTYHPPAGYTPQAAGTYWWYASYGGDANNSGSTSTCGSGMSSTTVAKASPITTAAAPASGAAGTAIAAGSIGATIANATGSAAGTVTFKVFGPQASAPTSCTSGGTPVGTASVGGNGTYNPSAGFTPVTAGTYWWYASYGGDANNSASGSSCGSGMSSTVVGKASPTSAVAAPGADATNTAISASAIGATLSNATTPATGAITFKVFGPQSSVPATCTTGGTTVGTATVTGAGTYNPPAGFTPTAPGTYWWYASYNGDPSNNASASTCGAGMTSTVVKNATALTASAPGATTLGTAIAAASIGSTLSGATTSPAAGGTITFTVFGPQASAPTTCTSGGTTVGTATVSGNGTYHPSASFTPSAAGTYWWYSSYNGDGNNSGSSSTCGSGMISTTVWSATAAANATDTAQDNSSQTSKFGVQASSTYLLLIFRGSGSGDAVTSISSSGVSPALTTSSFTQIASNAFTSGAKSYHEWAYWLTTPSNATGNSARLTVSFQNTTGSGQDTIISLVAIAGNDTANPIVTTNVATAGGSGATARANLPNAPAVGDGEAVILGGASQLGASAPTAPGQISLSYSNNSAGSAGSYGAVPALQNSSFTIPSQGWGTIAIELKHG